MGNVMALQRFIIERDIPKVGTFEREQLRQAAAKSNDVLRQLGPDIQWIESYVADNKTFCVYLAKDEAIIRRHAEISGFPATKITAVKKMIDPTTAAACAFGRWLRRSSPNPTLQEIFQKRLANYPVALR
jgi:Protein of unknown function (DUF4242)